VLRAERLEAQPLGEQDGSGQEPALIT
jgi:hypothetical protein